MLSRLILNRESALVREDHFIRSLACLQLNLLNHSLSNSLGLTVSPFSIHEGPFAWVHWWSHETSLIQGAQKPVKHHLTTIGEMFPYSLERYMWDQTLVQYSKMFQWRALFGKAHFLFWEPGNGGLFWLTYLFDRHVKRATVLTFLAFLISRNERVIGRNALAESCDIRPTLGINSTLVLLQELGIIYARASLAQKMR